MNTMKQGRPTHASPLGALLGAGVGLLLARSWPGALIGALLGHMFQKQVVTGGSRASQDAVLRAGALVELALSIANLDGPVDVAEREAIRSYFQRDAGLPASSLSTVDRMIDAALERGVLPPAEAAQAMPHLDAEDRVHVLFVLFRIALADRLLLPVEDRALAAVALGLGLAAVDYQGIRAHFVTDDSDGYAAGDDYALLGLDPTADLALVKEKYREAVKNYHPDRFQHLGDEFTSVAEEKFKKIQEAYHRITDGANPAPTGARLSVCSSCRTFSHARSLKCPKCGVSKHDRQANQIRIRCPFCTQINGLPESALLGQVRCGNCKVLLVR